MSRRLGDENHVSRSECHGIAYGADPSASFVRLAGARAYHGARSFGGPQVAAVSFIEQPADLAPIADLLSFSPKAESP